MRQALLALGLTTFSITSFAQGTLSGDLQTNVNFFNRDTTIAASGTPQYDNQRTGSESWLSLRYSQEDFSAFLRIDGFYNSNLYNPKLSYNGIGIGAMTLTKTIGELTVTGGTIYDQIGSGILYRAYEDRGLLIDNALTGLSVRFKPSDHFSIKGLMGNQKNTALFGTTLFPRYNPVIKALNAEGDFTIAKKVNMAPGFGILNRTLDESSMTSIAANINALPLEQRFVPKYNMYAASVYNTLTTGSLSIYTEAAYKTEEAIERDGTLQNLDGNVLYATASYAQKGFAVNGSVKRTQNFEMRTSPNEILLAGLMNWQPVIARLRPQRLLARYSPASQNLSELAWGLDGLIAPNDDVTVTLNYTHINTLEGQSLYREVYGDIEWRNLGPVNIQLGAQYLEYNRPVYQINPSAQYMFAFTPFGEITYRFNEKKSLRVEAEYMHTDYDLGPQVFLLAEYNVAPRWSIAVSDMYLLRPSNESPIKDNKHFYQFFGAYTRGPHRFTAAYVKQVEGINCTGGVCRYEPAFSGMKFSMTSSF
ncbi:MAG: hypothetical protein EOP52_07130 [Sphingobacteriales bacterium]|nr:MAG: hypothetical protein EOP52_07130 [Sphingobacteriales bacterium]